MKAVISICVMISSLAVVVTESSTCLTIYKQGGAPAVFRSPECPLWNLQNRASSFSGGGRRCHTAAIQGRREYQEDRLLCALDLGIPFPGRSKDVVVGIAAVFDGHNGAQASDMASKLFFDYFALHTCFLLDAAFSLVTGKLREHQVMHLHDINFDDDSLHLGILKEALLRTIHDVDATFTKEAANQKLDAGSTATIVLIADDQIMVANIGDSKALLCSQTFETPDQARATLVKLYRERRRSPDSSPSRFSDLKLKHGNGLVRLLAKELTKDHHPNREDEKTRVEAAGGYVTEWAGVPRVNGQLAVSRSIGDLSYRRYGVISAPEVVDWQPLAPNDSYLVVSTDGIFEKLESQDVCDRLSEVNNETSSGAGRPSYCSVSLADCLVNTAFEKGSMDNMAAVVVPLKPNLDSQSQSREEYTSDKTDEVATGLRMKKTYALPYGTFGPLQLEQGSAMFSELLVEVENSSSYIPGRGSSDA